MDTTIETEEEAIELIRESRRHLTNVADCLNTLQTVQKSQGAISILEIYSNELHGLAKIIRKAEDYLWGEDLINEDLPSYKAN